ncbi:hypothetical protein AQ911_30185 [Burkholderia pseudomallei]|nr:hypothetical protein AQ911_30185 [Burkholderia pseudomallei]
MEPGRKSESESESKSKSKSKPKRAPTGRSAFEREASRDETSACSPSAGAGDAPPIARLARLARVRETKSFYM